MPNTRTAAQSSDASVDGGNDATGMLAAIARDRDRAEQAAQKRHAELLLALTRSIDALAVSQRAPATAEVPGPSDVQGQHPVSAAAAPPRKLDVNKPPVLESSISLEQFDTWAATWNDFSDACQVSGLPLQQQTAHFRSFLSPEMRGELVHGIGVQDSDLVAPKDIIQKIRDYLRERRNITVDRVKFEQRSQHPGELFDDYLVELKKIAANADLCLHCCDQRLTTRIMAGIRSSDTRKMLLAMKPFPKLQAVVDRCRGEESAQANDQVLSGNGEHTQIQRMSRLEQRNGWKRQPNNRGRSRSYGKWQPGQRAPNTRYGSRSRDQVGFQKKECYNCGFEWHGYKNLCPAYDRLCNRCGKVGHFATKCRLNNRPKPDGRSDGQRAIRTVVVRQSTTSGGSTAAPKVAVDIHHGISGKWVGTVFATPDTGAEGTVIGIDVMEQLGIWRENLMPADNLSLLAANGAPLRCVGTAKITVKYQGHVATDRALFTPDHKGFLLPWYMMKELRMLPQTYPEPIDKVVNQARTIERAEVPLSDKLKTLLGDLPDEPSAEHLAVIKDKLIAEFSDVFDTGKELKLMDAPPFKIELRPGAVPFSVRVPRQVPYPWRGKVKALLDDMVAMKVIASAEGEPIEWCHSLVCVPKPGGDVRICVDLTKLNPYVVRPLHPLKTPKEAVSNVSNTAKFFTVCDATKGYWQLALDEKSQPLTTFITPWGRYKFLRAPMGLVSTGDEFCRVGDECLQGIDRMEKVVDDMMLYDDTFKGHIAHLWQVLQRCREKNITLNPKKLQFAQVEVLFVGYRVSGKGIAVDDGKLKAIRDLPSPKNLTGLRSFFRMINQITNFTATLSAQTEPLRPLLSKKVAFVWLPEHEKAFQEVKKALVDMPLLAHFESSLPTKLEADASRTKGLGFVLRQKHGDSWRIVECGSRFISPTESRYAMVELELLGVVWATSKCSVYLRGLQNYAVVVDHKPLVPILNSKTMADIDNPRIMRLKEKLAGYVFTTEWRKGTDHVIPDVLSRAPVDSPTAQDLELESELRLNLVQILETEIQGSASESETIKDPVLGLLQGKANVDEEYKALIGAVVHGFPVSKGQCSAVIAPYWKLKDNLAVENDLVVWDNRFVVPKAARKEILARLHAAHQGMVRMKRRARESVYWPGMNSDIENTASSCEKCLENQASQRPEPSMRDPLPSWVFEEVGTDLFQFGNNHYLVYVDRLSGWPVLTAYYNHVPTTREVVCSMRKCFADLGIPMRLRSDNGPQFGSREFKEFLQEWGVNHCPSSPFYPQSNGLAESTVKQLKALVKKTTATGRLDKDDDFWRALLEYRNTPRENGKSPADFLFGHPMRSILPVHKTKFAPEWQGSLRAAQESQWSILRRSDLHYNQRTKPLDPLVQGQRVHVQDARSRRWVPGGTVVEVGPYRKYLVLMPSEAEYWRNRRFLRPEKHVCFDGSRKGDGGWIPACEGR